MTQKLMVFGANRPATQLVISRIPPASREKRTTRAYFRKSKIHFQEKQSATPCSLILLGNFNFK
jgi:hypothetical protein